MDKMDKLMATMTAQAIKYTMEVGTENAILNVVESGAVLAFSPRVKAEYDRIREARGDET